MNLWIFFVSENLSQTVTQLIQHKMMYPAVKSVFLFSAELCQTCIIEDDVWMHAFRGVIEFYF